MSVCSIVKLFVLWFNLFILVSSYSHSKGKHFQEYDPDDLRILLSARRSRLLRSNSLLDIANHNKRKLASRVGPKICGGNAKILDSVVSMLDMYPDKIEDISVRYIFCTRNRKVPTIVPMSNKYIPKMVPPQFDPRKETVFIVHGFQSNGNARWINDMADAFLEWGDVNVIVVDWKKGGISWKYWKAFVNARTVGKELNRFIKFMVASAKLQPKKLHLIGHSLGAHICSHAAKGVKGIKRITGLDPSHVCFGVHYLGTKLGKSDADFVDVIHTYAGPQLSLYLGMSEALGHADFYPNGGSSQPACVKATANYNFISRAINLAICNHASAYLYFIETLRHPDCLFIAKPWDLSDDKKKTTQCALPTPSEGPAASPPCALMGMPADIMKANGTYYIETNKDEPWCQFVNLNDISKTARVMKLFMNLFRGY